MRYMSQCLLTKIFRKKIVEIDIMERLKEIYDIVLKLFLGIRS